MPYTPEELERALQEYARWVLEQAEKAPPMTPDAADLLPEDDVEGDDE
jgi:hypothetical protein